MEFKSGKIIGLISLIEQHEWSSLKEIVEKGEPAYSQNSVGYAYRNSYYVLKGTIQYGEEIKKGKKSCGCL